MTETRINANNSTIRIFYPIGIGILFFPLVPISVSCNLSRMKSLLFTSIANISVNQLGQQERDQNEILRVEVKYIGSSREEVECEGNTAGYHVPSLLAGGPYIRCAISELRLSLARQNRYR